jgi:hypothetical protein
LPVISSAGVADDSLQALAGRLAVADDEHVLRSISLHDLGVLASVVALASQDEEVLADGHLLRFALCFGASSFSDASSLGRLGEVGAISVRYIRHSRD